MHALLELLTQLVGIVGTIMDIVGRVTLLRLIISPIFSRVCRRIERAGTHITQDTPSVRAARRFTAIIPNLVWQILTWTIFIAGYVSKAMATWSNTTISIVHALVDLDIDFFACKFTSPTQKRMLDPCWYTFAIYQAWQISQRDYRDYVNQGGGGTP